MIAMKTIRRLFTIKTKFEAFLAIYALALGAVTRGLHYMEQYPGTPGKLLALACVSAVMIAGGLMIDAVTLKRTYES
ncbi:hypothetical protein SLG_17630 [Sphingobium sp. SYK-6]|nr:hypothetical protein SLG_17630 [Sphingobium sp. SYK-6]